MSVSIFFISSSVGVAILTKGRRKVVKQVEGSMKHLQETVRIFPLLPEREQIFPQRTGLYPSLAYQCSVSQDALRKSFEIFHVPSYQDSLICGLFDNVFDVVRFGIRRCIL